MALSRSFLRSRSTVLVVFILLASAIVLMPHWGGETAKFVPVGIHKGRDNAADAMVLSLYPSHTVATEGDTFQVMCLATGASEVTFDLPKISPQLLSSVRTQRERGKVVLTFSRVELGHQARYICRAESRSGAVKKSRNVDMVVVQRDRFYEMDVKDAAGEEEKMGMEGGEMVEGWEAVVKEREMRGEKEEGRVWIWDGREGVEGREEGEERDKGVDEGGWREGEDRDEGVGVWEGREKWQGVERGEREGMDGVEERDMREIGEGGERGEGRERAVVEEQVMVEMAGDPIVEAGKEVDVVADNNEAAAAAMAGAQVPVFETMEDRAKYQREQVDTFCQRHNLDSVKYKLPQPIPDRRNKNNEVYSYDRHLLLDDKHKILFCFVPKVGCTNLKLVVFVSQGIIRPSELHKARDAINQKALERAMFHSSFISIKDVRRKEQALHGYYKYTMFRNPLERLASGYRSKVERFPLHGLNAEEPHFNWLRNDIYSTQHPHEYELWKHNNRGGTPINISFSDFVDYWTSHPIVNKVDGFLDEHFLMISEMCQPCRTRFDFYGNFHHFERDAQVLIDKIGASSLDLRQGYYSEETATDQRMKLYYSTLSDEQKRAVLKKMALELEFHYTIFPEERDCHKHILGIDADIPLT